jgi:hypothetical protein
MYVAKCIAEAYPALHTARLIRHPRIQSGDYRASASTLPPAARRIGTTTCRAGRRLGFFAQLRESPGQGGDRRRFD